MKLGEIDDQLAASTRDSSAMMEQLNQRIGQLITDLQKMIKELSEIVKKMSKKLGG
jgi:methyl-accepting chemotaxis protein